MPTGSELVSGSCSEWFYFTLGVHRNTHHCLHHVHPPSSHFIDKLKDVELISLLQSLHHCIKSDESASATHTSTGAGDECTDTHTETSNNYAYIQYVQMYRHLDAYMV